MVKKTIYGIITGILAAAMIVFNEAIPLLLNVVFAFGSALAVRELFVAMNIEKKAFIFFIPTVVFSILFPFMYNKISIIFLWYFYTLIIFSLMIWFRKLIAFRDIAVIYSITILITFSLRLLILLRDMNVYFGTFYLVLTLLVACMTDTGAYFCGSFFGKNKLCVDISPNKTVEGAIGGVVLSIIAVIVVGLVFQFGIFKSLVEINYFYLIVIAFIGSLISVIGDLGFSMVKRGCNVKDFGNFIPGHGGVLDRVDSIIFISPFMFLAISLLTVIKFV